PLASFEKGSAPAAPVKHAESKKGGAEQRQRTRFRHAATDRHVVDRPYEVGRRAAALAVDQFEVIIAGTRSNHVERGENLSRRPGLVEDETDTIDIELQPVVMRQDE